MNPLIIVRCKSEVLVYNRINYDGKVISSQNDFKRNEIETKKLKDKYGLTYAEDKSKTNLKKLNYPERVRMRA